MNNRPFIKLKPVARTRKESLSRWLSEWNLDRQLREPDALKEVSNVCAGERGTVDQSCPEVGPADVLLLYPGKDPRDCPVYVAVLRRIGDLFYHVAPFGRFAEPATQDEWRTGRETGPLRVLCLWNSRVVSGDRLTAVWHVDRLDKGEISDLSRLDRAMESGNRLPEDLEGAVGAPLIHPLDPRHEYLEEEFERLNRALETGREKDPAMKLVAEQGVEYGEEIARYRVLHTTLRLVVSSEGEDMAQVRVIDPAGNTSWKLNGGILFNDDGIISEIILKGIGRAPGELFKSEFRVVNHYGQLYRTENDPL